VGFGDHLDNRQAQSRPASRSRRIGPRKALEGARQEPRREAMPLVEHVELDGAASAVGAQ
jgi:hypothetical protein